MGRFGQGRRFMFVCLDKKALLCIHIYQQINISTPMKRFFIGLLCCLGSVVCMAQYDQLTNLPTIYIETFGNQAVTSKVTYVYATLTYVNGSNIVQYDSLQIRGRGNSTWGLAKKPYRIKFNESTKFLGKGYAKNKNWTLLANHGDKSLLRNAVTFTLGDFMGQPFSPAAHFVDLVLNGTYLGNYQVSDQVNVDDKRVEVYEQEEVATDSSNITGGYLIEVDGFGTSEDVYFRTNRNLIVSVKSPDEDVINTAQRNYIKQYLNDFESSLFGSSFTDPEYGYRAIADSATLVSWYLATELSANVDGFWSTYLYKDRDDPKLYFGPLWDYDIAYNNCNRVGDVTNRDMIEAGFGDDLTKVWVKRMIQDPWFNKAVNDAWKQKVEEGLEQYLYNYIDSMAAHLDRSQQKNYGKYSITSRTYNEIYLYSTYADYIEQLKHFIGDHMDFLTARFAERANDVNEEEKPAEPLRPFELTDGYYYRIYNKGTNKVLDIADGVNSVVIWSPTYGRDTQLWKITKVGECFHIVNKATGMAINDPSPTSAVGTPLDVAISDTEDSRQLWICETVNENDNYNIINVYTDHAINNSGGSASDGNNILSYTNDDRNAVSNNRQWRIVPEEMIPDYIPEEVRDDLAATIAEAEAFLASLADWKVGTGDFCYSEEKIGTLRQMVVDAKMFESTVVDDYILANVNLSEQLTEARKQQLPSPEEKYVIRHKASGCLLTVEDDNLVVLADVDNDKQHFLFETADVANGVYLKSVNGLYVSLGTTESSGMVGRESVANGGWSTYYISVEDGCYHIHTIAGLMGTDPVMSNGRIYADNSASLSDELLCSEWIIEEYVDLLADVKDSLETLTILAKEEVYGISVRWMGLKPMQHSRDRVNALKTVISEAESCTYTTVEEYEDLMLRLSQALAQMRVLNAPNEDSEYLLTLSLGYSLSCEDGVTLVEEDEQNVTQRFRLIPVADAVNTYNLYTNGLYVTVADVGHATLSLTETPRDKWGQFVAEQVSSKAFTLRSVVGYLGARDSNAIAGDACVPDVKNVGIHARWTLIEAPDPDMEDGIAPHTYESAIDYVVVYDKDAESLCFVSDDMEALAKIDVKIYTVGGRLLYVFKASEQCSLIDLPSGTYIVRWSLGAVARDVKFKK